MSEVDEKFQTHFEIQLLKLLKKFELEHVSENIIKNLQELGVTKMTKFEHFEDEDVKNMELSKIDQRAMLKLVDLVKSQHHYPEAATSIAPSGKLAQSREKSNKEHESMREGSEPKSSPSGYLFAFFKEDATPFKSNHQIRKFLLATFFHDDDMELISKLGSPCGLQRLEEIAQWEMNVHAGGNPRLLSFQRVILLLLKTITKERFQRSALSQNLLQIYGTLHKNKTFEENICVCLQQLTREGSLTDRNFRPDSLEAGQIWTPRHWGDAFCPVVRYFSHIVCLFKDVQGIEKLKDIFQQIKQMVVRWNIIDSKPAVSAELLKDVAKCVGIMQHNSRKAQPICDDSSIYQRSLNAAANSDPWNIRDDLVEGPGTLRSCGTARHDNDHLHIADISVAPTWEEALSNETPFLPRNEMGAFHHLSGVERLLDIHFRLLREDFMRKLRTGVSSYWKGGLQGKIQDGKYHFGEGDSMFVFSEPTVAGISVDIGNGVSYLIEFDDVGQNIGLLWEKRKEYWSKSKRLQCGSLVCLCWKESTGFPALIFATVSCRDDDRLAPQDSNYKNKSRPARLEIQVSTLCSGSAYDENLFARLHDHHQAADIVMMQASNDFFSYQPFLKALQTFDPATFPFKNLLTGRHGSESFNHQVNAPSYLSEEATFDLTILISEGSKVPKDAVQALKRVQIFDSASRTRAWKILGEYSSLDESQLSALESALTKEIVLIQGPPGTGFANMSTFCISENIFLFPGKSFIGIKLVQILILNAQSIPHSIASDEVQSTPILTVCYTNHALDQFLEGILCNGVKKIVRLGGRSKSILLEPFALKELVNAYGSKSQKHLLSSLGKKLNFKKAQIMSKYRFLFGSPASIEFNDIETFLDIEFSDLDFDLQKLFQDGTDGFKTVGRISEINSFSAWQKDFCPYPGCRKHFPGGMRDTREFRNYFQCLGKNSKPVFDFDYVKDKVVELLFDRPQGVYMSQFKHMIQSFIGCDFVLDYKQLGANKLTELLNKMSDVLEIRSGNILLLNEKRKVLLQNPVMDFVMLRSTDEIPKGSRVTVMHTSGDYSPSQIVSVDYEGSTFKVENDSIAPMHTTDRPFEELETLMHVPWSFSQSERLKVIEYLCEKFRDSCSDAFRKDMEDFEASRVSFREMKDQISLEIMRSASVVGMTTSGAAMNQHILQKLGPRIVVVEEAAEVLEAHVLSSLSSCTQQLILIGDHQQLRPKIQEHELRVESRRGFDLDLSLFERLIASKMPHNTLSTQRRMRPSVSRLIRETLYCGLIDSEVVEKYPPVRGMAKDVYFFNHNHPEAGDEADSKSKSNDFEVEMAVELAAYLLRQGYSPGDITILTPYVGQLQKIREVLSRKTMVFVDSRDLEELSEKGSDEYIEMEVSSSESVESVESNAHIITKDTINHRVRVATVDNFQGEESTIIILSLVRNNSHGQIGFLKTANRVNVMLSRAKHGMYIMGNSPSLVCERSSKIWCDVLDILHQSDAVGDAFQLRCPNHPGIVNYVSIPSDFKKFAQDGGCSLQCDFVLNCGHQCPRKCHPDDTHHLATFCTRPCERLRKTALCPDQHPCRLKCGEDCGNCKEKIFGVQLPCGHVADIVECHMAQQPQKLAEKCESTTEIIMPDCEHQVSALCCHVKELSQNPDRCPSLCNAPLSCGHPCRGGCGECKTISLSNRNRRLKTRRVQAASDEGTGFSFQARSEVPLKVDQLHKACKMTCEKALGCGHLCKLQCHEKFDDSDSSPSQCETCKLKCFVKCDHSECKKDCSEPCVPCLEECTWGAKCPHLRPQCSLPCGAPCNRLPCDAVCRRQLKCGHQCPAPCGEICPPREQACRYCMDRKKLDTCIDEARKLNLKMYREERHGPLIVLSCGHLFTMRSLDDHVGLKNYYTCDAEDASAWGKCKGFPSKFQEIPCCPRCKSPIIGVRRYGRIVNKATIDQINKKYITAFRQKMESIALEKCIRELKFTLAQDLRDRDLLINVKDQLAHGVEKVLEMIQKIHPLQALTTSVQSMFKQKAAGNREVAAAEIMDDLPDGKEIRFEAAFLLVEAKIAQITLLSLHLNDSKQTSGDPNDDLNEKETESILLSIASSAATTPSHWRTASYLSVAIELLKARIAFYSASQAAIDTLDEKTMDAASKKSTSTPRANDEVPKYLRILADFEDRLPYILRILNNSRADVLTAQMVVGVLFEQSMAFGKTMSVLMSAPSHGDKSSLNSAKICAKKSSEAGSWQALALNYFQRARNGLLEAGNILQDILSCFPFDYQEKTRLLSSLDLLRKTRQADNALLMELEKQLTPCIVLFPTRSQHPENGFWYQCSNGHLYSLEFGDKEERASCQECAMSNAPAVRRMTDQAADPEPPPTATAAASIAKPP